jgi:hypothetical protein
LGAVLGDLLRAAPHLVTRSAVWRVASRSDGVWHVSAAAPRCGTTLTPDVAKDKDNVQCFELRTHCGSKRGGLALHIGSSSMPVQVSAYRTARRRMC